MDAWTWLRRYPLFTALGREALAPWLAAAVPREVALGQTLFQAGRPGRDVYLVDTARLRVSRLAKSQRDIVLGSFGPGEIVGEYAVLAPGLNLATCRAADPGRVLQLPLAPLKDALARQPAIRSHLKRWLRLHSVLGHVRDRSFLGFMSAASLLPMLDRLTTACYPAGRAVQADGLSNDCWFVIVRGRVKLERPPGEAGGPPVILGPGDSFGEDALLGRGDLPLAESLDDLECMVLARVSFLMPLGATIARDSVQTRASNCVVPGAAYPWVAQEEADCGVAALAMIARYHGLNHSVADLRRTIAVGARGTTLLQLQQAGASLGFHARSVLIDEGQLSRVTLPALAHLSDGHYVVLYSISGVHLLIGDPAAGVLTLGMLDFRTRWSGHLLLLTLAN
jgi:CRP-like cAMP-binding protein